MKRILKWSGIIGLALGVYMVSLAITAPAHVVWQQIDDRVTARVHAPTGTLLSGQARAVTWPDGGRLDKVTWRFEPAALLNGSLGVDIDAQLQEGTLNGHIRYQPWSGIALRDVRLDASLRDVLLSAARPEVVNLASGRISGDLAHASIANGQLLGAQGVITWREARLGLGSGFDFGQVNLKLAPKTDAEGTRGELTSRGGTINVEGELDLKPRHRFALDASIGGDGRPNETTRQLRGLLGLGEDGRIRVSGAWRDGGLQLERTN